MQASDLRREGTQAAPANPTPTPSVSTVWIVDDEPAVRTLISHLVQELGQRPRAFATGGDFLAAFDPDQPGCLVLDLKLPDLSGIDLLGELRQRKATQPIIVISGYAEVAHAVQAMKMGVHDFLEKPFTNDVLLRALRGGLAKDSAERSARAEVDDIGRRLARLTPRERQVMDMVVKGSSNKDVAAALGLSPKTVEVYRANVMAKMNAGSLAELVRLVVRFG